MALQRKTFDALRECLIDRYHDDLLEVTAEMLAPEIWEQHGLAERAEVRIRGVVETCVRRHGLMRMRVLHFAINPDAITKNHLDGNQLSRVTVNGAESGITCPGSGSILNSFTTPSIC